MTEGRKDDSGKDPWHLAPWDAFRAIVKVLRFGANKYSTVIGVNEPEDVQQWIDYLMDDPLAPVTQISIDMSETAGVEVATSATCADPTLHSLSGSGKTELSGGRITPTRLESWEGRGSGTPLRVAETPAPSEPNSSLNSAPRQKKSWHFESISKIHVASADEASMRLVLSMSITITLRDGSEESFAVDATTVSGCLATASAYLAQRFNTWPAPRLLNFASRSQTDTLAIVSGARNWERGMAWSRPFAALQRHLTAWWEGERADPETGMSHLWHAGCCIVFLISFELRGIGTDDRPLSQAAIDQSWADAAVKDSIHNKAA